MSNPLERPIQKFVEGHDIVTGAVLADLDGTYVAVYPDEHKDTLCHCAVFAGVALRRASIAELRAGRGAVHEISLDGETGSFITVRVGEDYQVVTALKNHTPASRIREASRSLAKSLAVLIEQSPIPKVVASS